MGDFDLFSNYKNSIDGKLVGTKETRHGINPATGEANPEVPVATQADVDAAVEAGLKAFKTWSKTQSLIALSSAESEFYAALKAAAEGLGMLSVMKDLSWKLKGRVMGDASAALGIIHRKGH